MTNIQMQKAGLWLSIAFVSSSPLLIWGVRRGDFLRLSLIYIGRAHRNHALNV